VKYKNGFTPWILEEKDVESSEISGKRSLCGDKLRM